MKSDKISYPVLATLIASAIASIAAKVKTGDWKKWSNVIPKIWSLIIGAVIFLWFIGIVVWKRYRKIRSHKPYPSLRVSVLGWQDIDTVDHAGVIWRVRISKDDGFFDIDQIPASALNIALTPRCPKRGTELEESDRFWGGYTWKCVNFDFQKNNRGSFSTEAASVEKKAKRKWETRRHV